MKMNNNLSASDYRSRARESLKGKYWPAVGVTLLASLIMGGVGGASFSFNMSEENVPTSINDLIPQSLIPLIAGIFATVIVIALAIAVAHFIVTGVTQMGLAKYNIKLCMGEDANLKDLFAYYKTRLGTGILAKFLVDLFLSLWSLLVIVPLFSLAFAMVIFVSIPFVYIFYYRYVLVYYLLADDDTLGAVAAIRKSKELMKGNKWKLFCLDISFIGWEFLGAMACCGMGTYFVAPYIGNARAHFYCELVGKNNVVELDTSAQELDYTLETSANTNAQELDYTADNESNTDVI